MVIAACAPPAPTPTPGPTNTPTLRATLLPTVATQVPFGSEDRPFEVLLVPPEDSSATGTSLASFLNDRTGRNFKVAIATTQAEILAALCGPVPTFAWADGWTLLAAQARGCGTAALLVQQNGATGIASDIILSKASQVNTVQEMFRGKQPGLPLPRDLCRVRGQDLQTFVLPVAYMRTVSSNLDPMTAFRSVKFYDDVNAIAADVVDNKCVAAIPAGTLSGLNDAAKMKVIGTTPELPYGGLIVSSSVPTELANTVVSLFTKNPNQLKDLVAADDLTPASREQVDALVKTFAQAGFDFRPYGVNAGQ